MIENHIENENVNTKNDSNQFSLVISFSIRLDRIAVCYVQRGSEWGVGMTHYVATLGQCQAEGWGGGGDAPPVLRFKTDEHYFHNIDES